MLDQETKSLWVDGLRSGRFKQGYVCLKERKPDGYTYCCLGVLCELKGLKELNSTLTTEIRFTYNERSSCMSLPGNLRRDVGLQDMDERRLMTLNDNKKLSFNEIADYIEKNL